MKRFMILVLLVIPAFIASATVSFSTSENAEKYMNAASLFNNEEATASVDAVLNLTDFSYFSLGIYDNPDDSQSVEEVVLDLIRDGDEIKAVEDVEVRFTVKYIGGFDLSLLAGNPDDQNTGRKDVIHWKAELIDDESDAVTVWTGRGHQEGDYKEVVIYSHDSADGNYVSDILQIRLETVDLSDSDQQPAKLEEPLTVFIRPKGE